MRLSKERRDALVRRRKQLATTAPAVAPEHLRNERLLARSTLWLAVGTVVLALASMGSDYLLLQAGGDTAAAVDIARQSMIADGRAWVGPSDAAMPFAPTKGQPLRVTITYQNTGREPATFFRAGSDAFSGDSMARGAPLFLQIIQSNNACVTSSELSDGAVFPGATTTYTQDISVKADLITQEVIDGSKLLAITGCYNYVTFGEIRHTFFCYYYKAAATKMDHMAICDVGNTAT